MAIEFVCPVCQGTLRVSADTAGRVVRCGSCMTVLRVPTSAPAPPEPPQPAEPPDDAPRRRAAEPVMPPRPASPRPRRRRGPPPKSGKRVLFWVVAIVLVLGFLTVAACGGLLFLLQPQWQTHESPAGGFKVDLPAAPRDMSDRAGGKNQPGAQVEGTVLVSKVESYLVSYEDLGPRAGWAATDEEILKEAVNELVQESPGSRVLSNIPVPVSGLPGREVVLAHPDDGIQFCRIVLADTRLYVIVVGGPQITRDGNERVRRFLDSFAITDPKILARAKEGNANRELAEQGARAAKELTRKRQRDEAKEPDDEGPPAPRPEVAPPPRRVFPRKFD